MSTNENADLLAALERNTAAVRSLSIFFIGYIPYLLVGGLAILGGTNTANLGDSATAGVLFILAIGILIFGAIRTISKALKELKFSERPKSK
jgi:hypothetical protein